MTTKTNLPLSQPVQNKDDIKAFSQMLFQTTILGINEKKYATRNRSRDVGGGSPFT